MNIKKLLLFIMIQFSIVSLLLSAEYTWTGAVDTDWATIGNWADSIVPTSSDNVTVPGSLSNYPDINETANCLALTIQSGASVTISTGASLSTAEDIFLYGTLTIDDDSLTTASGKEIHVYSGGTFDLNGGVVTVADEFRSKAGCTVDISGGILSIGSDWSSSSDGTYAQGTITLSGGTITVADDCRFLDTDVSGTMTGNFQLTVGDEFKNNAENWAVDGGTVICDASYDSSAFAYATSTDLEVYNLTINGGSDDYFYLTSNSSNRGIIIVNDFTLTSGKVRTGNGSMRTDKFTVGGTFSMGADANFKDVLETGDTYSVGSYSFDINSEYIYSGGTRVINYTPTYGNLIIETDSLAAFNDTLNIDNYLDIDNGGLVQVNAGSNITIGGNLYVTDGEFELNSGTVSVGKDFRSLLNATVDINGGTLDIEYDWELDSDGNSAKGTIELSSGTINVGDDCLFSSSDVTGSMTGDFNLSVGDDFRNNNNGWATVTGGTITLEGASGSAYVTATSGSYDLIAYNLIINGAGETFDFSSSTSNRGVIINNDFTFTAGIIETKDASTHTDKFTVGGTFSMGSGAHFKDAILDSDTYTVNAFSFDPASTYEYYSDVAQTVDSDRPASYGNLTINNEVDLGQATTINGTLALTNGPLTTTTTNLLVMGSASSVSGGSNASYVDGPMANTWPGSGSSTKTFPLGKDSIYRPFDMTLSTSSNQVIRAEVFNENASGNKGTLDAISTVRYYETSVTTGTVGNVATAKITFGNDDGVSSVENIVVARATTKTGIYGSLGQNTNTSTTVTSNTYDPTEAGDFILLGSTSGDNPLPISLTSFTAEENNANVILSWTSESETENQGFIIEKRMTTDSDWVQIASYLNNDELEGNGTTTETHNYNFTDNNVQAGVTYTYRLGDVNYNGEVIWHNEIEITIENNNEQIPTEFGLQKAYPNPFNPAITLSYGLMEDAHTTLLIYDMNGQLVETLHNSFQTTGTYELSWRPMNLASGVYIVHLRSGSNTNMKKIVFVK